MNTENTSEQKDENLTYEEKLLGVLRNFCFSSYEPFIVPILPSKADSDYFYKVFIHGCIYRQICFILNKNLELEEHLEIFNTLGKRIEDEDVIYSYNEIDLVRVEDCYDGERYRSYIYPLFGPCIRFDVKNKIVDAD